MQLRYLLLTTLLLLGAFVAVTLVVFHPRLTNKIAPTPRADPPIIWDFTGGWTPAAVQWPDHLEGKVMSIDGPRQVTIILPDGRVATYRANLIHVFRDGPVIYSVKLFLDPLELDDAVTLAKGICTQWGVKYEPSLDEWSSRRRSDPTGKFDRKGTNWIATAEKGRDGVAVQVVWNYGIDRAWTVTWSAGPVRNLD